MSRPDRWLARWRCHGSVTACEHAHHAGQRPAGTWVEDGLAERLRWLADEVESGRGLGGQVDVDQLRVPVVDATTGAIVSTDPAHGPIHSVIYTVVVQVRPPDI